MSFEQLSYLAQIVASIGVIVSLIFVGLQIKHNTGALQRNEHNSTIGTMDGDSSGNRRKPRHCRAHDRWPSRRARPGCCRSAKAGADAGRIRLGGFPHLGQNATRCFSEGNVRSDMWATPVRRAQDSAWRDLVE